MFSTGMSTHTQYVEANTKDKPILLRISIEPKFIQNLTLEINFLNRLVNMRKKLDVWEDFKPELGRQHVSFEGERSLLPELKILGWLRFSRAFDQALKPDVHEQEYEIHYIVKGKLNWWVEDKNYSMRSGMVMIIKPNENHGSRTGVLEPCEHYWLRFSFPEKDGLPGLDVAETQLLREAFIGFKYRMFSVSSSVWNQFSLLLEEHRLRKPHSATVCRAAFHHLLILLVREYGRTNGGIVLNQISSNIE